MGNILYFGDDNPNSTSLHRANALRRLGHTVIQFDPKDAVQLYVNHPLMGYFHYRTGYRFVQTKIKNWIEKKIATINTLDLIWIDSGELLDINCIILLKSFNRPVILYNQDDPTGNRDKGRFGSLIDAITLYDLVVVVRSETEKECHLLGCKNVLKVWRSYDEVAHKPFEIVDDIADFYRSEVAFVGTWMRFEKRDEFLLHLIEQGISVNTWGDRWQKSPHRQKLTKYYRGGALSGSDYVSAIQGAKISLGLLSKGNRDRHTVRTMEIPFAGGLLCAQRTTEHSELYQEGVEAVFWDNADECAAICKKLLNDDFLRENIRVAGMNRVRQLNVGNEDICKQILNYLSI